MGRYLGFLPTRDFNNPNKVTLTKAYPVGGTGQGKVTLLYKYYEKMLGKVTTPRDQGKGSDCVGQSTARAIDVIQGVQIEGLGLAYVWDSPASASSIYGGSRYEIARRRYNHRLRGDGSYVPYAAEFVRDYGCLYMKKYPSVDLTNHSWSLSKHWGYYGVPDDLEPTAKRHAINRYIPVGSYPEIRDAISNGWPVVVGSSFGFKGQPERDNDGFLEPNGTWMHAMVITAIDDQYRRPGGLIENSWGRTWVKGPKRHGQPDGSFWVDADVLEDMARKGEAIALSGHNGFERPRRDYNLL